MAFIFHHTSFTKQSRATSTAHPTASFAVRNTKRHENMDPEFTGSVFVVSCVFRGQVSRLRCPEQPNHQDRLQTQRHGERRGSGMMLMVKNGRSVDVKARVRWAKRRQGKKMPKLAKNQEHSPQKAPAHRIFLPPFSCLIFQPQKTHSSRTFVPRTDLAPRIDTDQHG